MSLWIYESQPIDETILDAYVGFVYCITNLVDNKKYIGKKLLKFKKSKTVKGKKKKFLVESDWKKYWGSNKNLIADVEELGEDKFVREILKLCKSKGECNYYELREQMIRDVLLKPEEYYNSYVGTRINRQHILRSLSFTISFSTLSSP
jgi:hypothetical protein